MPYFAYKFLLHGLLRLPDPFFAALFVLVHPVYKALHMKRAYGRVIGHLQKCGFSERTPGVTARDVFKSLYWNGIDSYRLLARIPSATRRVRYENEQVIQSAVAQGPVVAMSIHQGAFENMHRTLCRYSEHVHLVTNTFKSGGLTRALREVRSDPHLSEYSPEDVGKVIRNLFKTKGILAMVVDQARNTKGNLVQLFGRDTTIYLRLAVKANQMGAGVVTFRTFSETVTGPHGGKRREHVVRFEKYYPPRFDQNELVQSIAKEIESWIADHPEQWCWNYHRNFTTQDNS